MLTLTFRYLKLPCVIANLKKEYACFPLEVCNLVIKDEKDLCQVCTLTFLRV